MAEAMKACHGEFPPLVVEMVDVGEETGRLGQVCLNLAKELDHRLKLRRTFLKVIAWPLIQLITAICVMAFLLWVLQILLPEPPFGKHALRRYLTAVATVAALTTLVVLAVIKGWFNGILTRIAMRIPVLGPTIHAGAMARLTWTLAAALDAGVDARRAVRMALRSTDNFMYTGVIETAVDRVQKGHAFHEALGATGVFSDDFLHRLSIAEMSGTYAEALQRLADEYEQQFQTRTTALAAAAGVLIWILIGAILVAAIMFLFFRLYLQPINQLLDDVSWLPTALPRG